MQDIPKFSETTIRQHAAGDSFSRGQQYYRQGAVTGLVLRDNSIQAEVEGSDYEPYKVRVTFDAGGITAASCTCPYGGGGWCKHIIATLLACIHQPEAIDVRPDLEQLLAGLDRDQLQNLVLHLAARDPAVADEIEIQISLLQAAPAATQPAQPATIAPVPTRHTPVDVQPVRRQIRAILRPSRYEYGYGYASGAVEQVREVLEQAQRFTEGGDGHNALRLLEAITDEYSQDWYELDDSDGELGGFFDEMASYWAEALLTADLTPAERREWSRKLAHWQHEAEDYGVGDEFAMARTAAEQGWDDPALQRVLRGEIAEQGTEEDEPADYPDELALIRLKVLERQGRFQEYLYLAQAEGQLKQYVTMLARMGRAQEAVDEGLKQLATADAALAPATVLREQGELELAVRLAEHGLTLAEPRGPLAAWLSDLAEGLGKHDLALRAAEVSFRSVPSLAAYLKVRDLAGDRWPGLRAALLEHLRTNAAQSYWFHGSAAVDVFLHEGLVDDAIAVVQKGAGYGLLERVMDAAITSRPDWVIQAATAQAERIMDAGKAQSYDHAIDWLRRARDAYQAAGREKDWQEYLAELRVQHGRKYKLMGLMKGL
jgi:uncharacterized Zn finger protein